MKVRTRTRCFLTVLTVAIGIVPCSLGGGPDFELDVFPRHPTSAQIVEIRLNGGSDGSAAVAGRAADSIADPTSITNTFFARQRDLEDQETYRLGVLAPGSYRFVLFLTGGSGPACFNEQVAELRFAVRAAGRPRSGRLALVIDSSDETVLEDVVETLNPTSGHFFPTLERGSVNVPLGLTGTYAEHLAATPGVLDVDLGGVGGGLGGCSSPLPRYSRGNLSLSLAVDVDEAAFDELVQRQLPEVDAWETRRNGRSTTVVVNVPVEWEAYFLARYLEDPRVQRGGVVPGRPPTGHGVPPDRWIEIDRRAGR